MKRQIVGLDWVNWYINFPGRNFGIRSLFDAYNSSLERSIRALSLLEQATRSIPWTRVAPGFPKKRRLGPQNGSGSLGPEKLLKIVNCTIIKESEKLKETVVGVQMG